MRLGTETNSLVNHLYSGAKMKEPEVGMGATVLCWTDRKAGTIVEVTDAGFTVQLDKATRTDNYGMSDTQHYAYEPDPSGSKYTFARVKRGKAKGAWRENGSPTGNGVLIGHRDHHYDFSF